ncbi:MAG: DUF3048 domain-containing protein [Defluviitaleaceae bacterium]|nr:DUF3048 domain-containing protein [Defluviitaleaceae bacterium]
MKKLILLIFLASCSAIYIETAEEIQLNEQTILQPTQTTAQEQEQPQIIKTKNPLTGIYYEGEKEFHPVAVVINNITAALPQSGISEADVIYEVLSEGGITRLIAIFTNSEAEKIGPIRSTREYFSNIALEWNAPLVHHGGSPSGYNAIRSLNINNMDGFYLEGTYFWRDEERRRRGLLEHSSYTNWENILSFLENSERGTSYWQGVYFKEELENYEKTEIKEVIINFSTAHEARFILEDNIFRRYQRGIEHIDEHTNKQIYANNLIIQRATHSQIANDPEGRININLTGSGIGYLITKHGYKEITWQHTEAGTLWNTLAGDNITLSPGKTWVSIIGTGQNVTLVTPMEDSEENYS